MRLVLASASPRRRDILAQLGLAFEVRPSDYAEPDYAGGDVEAFALELARRKALDVHRQLGDPQAVVLAADTIVCIGGDVLGKPVDDAHAARMLARLAGCEHRVVTGVHLTNGADLDRSFAAVTRVRFRAFDAGTARRYAASGEGRDKAGAYAIQGLGAGLVESIDGSYSNVVGLPATQTLELLLDAGVVLSWP